MRIAPSAGFEGSVTRTKLSPFSISTPCASLLDTAQGREKTFVKIVGQVELTQLNSHGSAIPHRISPDAELTESGRRDFAVKNSYALQGDAQVLLVSTDEAGLGFSDQ